MKRRRQGTADESLPELEPGLTLLETPDPRSTALHQLALNTIQQTDGIAYWVDARNTSSSYTLHDMAPHRRILRRIRLARGFTAYQHFQVVRRVVNQATGRTGSIILPNLASLYRDDDVPMHESEPMLNAVLGALSEVADVYDIPVLVTDAAADAFTELVAEQVATSYECERTPMGYRFVGDDYETTVYWADGYWQTTIPYWVDLLGVAEEQADTAGIGPITPATMGGT
ncbi:hypothetical protein Harman_11600 [Haloarcula mannanilytica]|uniref:Uncharacterized protein n=1 Tax=Haloarcula mannanilytica TaxID=2509225 RepID=A0A4C2EFK0_9EURY|nr:hypothetical protein [Haloarcula mannanilytica]GCF13225.1 hypothetical protein Harman_11600 [Haloarcula mannanilytica]